MERSTGRSSNKRSGRLITSERGETLIETLFAILISSGAILILYMMMQTSINLTNSGKEQMDAYYKENNQIGTLSSSSEANLAKVKVKDEDGNEIPLFYTVTDDGSGTKMNTVIEENIVKIAKNEKTFGGNPVIIYRLGDLGEEDIG